MSLFVTFKFPTGSSPRTSRRRRGRKPRRQMPASAGLHCRGHCRRDIAGQGKRRTDPRAAPRGKPECSSGLLLVLHSGIPPGRL
ncbi:unnamed protein product, partial [Staurois parvus]